MPQTLKDLIASRNLAGRTVSDACHWMEGHDFEAMLFDHGYQNHAVEHAHTEAFFAAETIHEVEIDTWICTDQMVGLTLLCLNGTPVALSWQTGRKSDRNIKFLSAEARALLLNAWERHRPTPVMRADFVDDAVLDMPIAPAGAEAFEVDRHAPIERLRLSIVGVAQFIQSTQADGGVVSVCHEEALRSAFEAAEHRWNAAETTIGHIDAMSDEEHAKRPWAATQRDELAKEVAFIEKDLLLPLETRLSDFVEIPTD